MNTISIDSSGAIAAAEDVGEASGRIKGGVDGIHSSFEKLAGQFGSVSGKFNTLVGNFLGLEGGLFKLGNPLSLVADKFINLATKMAGSWQGTESFKGSLENLIKSFDSFVEQLIKGITNLPIVSNLLGLVKKGIVFVTEQINKLSKSLSSGLAFDLLVIEAKLWTDTFGQGIKDTLEIFGVSSKEMGGGIKSFGETFKLHFGAAKHAAGAVFSFVRDAILNLPVNLKTAFAIMIAEGDKLWMSMVKSFDLFMIDLKTGWEKLGYGVGNVARSIELVFAKVVDGIVIGLASAIKKIGELVSNVPGFEVIGEGIVKASERLKGFATNTESVKAATQAANAEHQNTLNALKQERQEVEDNFTRKKEIADQSIAEKIAERDQILANRAVEREQAFSRYEEELPGEEKLPGQEKNLGLEMPVEQAITEPSPEEQAVQEKIAEAKALEEEKQLEAYARETEQFKEHLVGKKNVQLEHFKNLFGDQKKIMKTMEGFNKMSFENQMGTALGFMTKMASGSKSASKKMFEVNKAFALANAAVSLPDAVVQSFRNGGGYPWGLIPAGIMLAKGMQQINTIRSATFGGGQTAAPSVSGGGSVPVGPASISTSPAAPTVSASIESETEKESESASRASRGAVSINVSGVITQEIVDDLMIPAIQEAVENRDVVLIRNGTRNAEELGGY